MMAAIVALAGCSLAPATPKPELAVPATYKEVTDLQTVAERNHWQAAHPAEGEDRGIWWSAFNDAQLNELEQQAASANPTLASAAARVKAAHAILRGAKADRSPEVGVGISGTRAKAAASDLGYPDGTDVAPANSFQAGLTASYELDLFGRVANSVAAARADSATTDATYRSVLLALQGDVAQTYYQLRTLDAEVALLDRTIGLRQQNVDLTEKRYAAGDVGELDVVRARSELATTQSEAAGLRGDRARTEHALALLLGQVPASFTFTPKALEADAAVPFVPAGLPSSLLERRPDVAAAQAQMVAATARVGLARAAQFPSLTLTAEGGYASTDLSDLFKWDVRTWLINALLSMPIIDGGRNQANITRAQAALEGSVADYRQSVLAAFGDVEDKLSGLSSVRNQTEALDRAVVAARRASDLADKRYRAGEDSYLTLIDAQRNLLSIERQAVELRGAWATSTVGLIRALGGGWTAPDATVASAR